MFRRKKKIDDMGGDWWETLMEKTHKRPERRALQKTNEGGVKRPEHTNVDLQR